jgi:hypothetical protein
MVRAERSILCPASVPLVISSIHPLSIPGAWVTLPDRNNFFAMLRIANSHLHFSVAAPDMLPCGNRKAGEQRPYGFSFLAGRLTR